MNDTPFNKHSPVPWQVNPNNLTGIIVKDGTDVENVAFTVEACNSYYKLKRDNAALLAALKGFVAPKIEVLTSDKTETTWHTIGDGMAKLLDDARAAIAAVEVK